MLSSQQVAPPRSYRAAVARLGAAQKPKSSTPAYLLYVNRKLGGRAAAVGHVLGLTPNQMTAASAFVSALGIAVLAAVEPTWWVGVLVSALLLLGYALDSADGQLARLRGGGSPAGGWLDHVTDTAKTSALHGAVLLTLLRAHPDRTWVLLLPLAFLVVTMTTFFGLMQRDALLPGSATRREESSRRALLRSIALLPTDFGVLALCFVLLGSPTSFLVGYSLLLLSTALFGARALRRAFVALRDA
ncbi:CDP-alcohol phosphatidyltransferase family protein [Angustibacter peucedani]